MSAGMNPAAGHVLTFLGVLNVVVVWGCPCPGTAGRLVLTAALVALPDSHLLMILPSWFWHPPSLTSANIFKTLLVIKKKKNVKEPNLSVRKHPMLREAEEILLQTAPALRHHRLCGVMVIGVFVFPSPCWAGWDPSPPPWQLQEPCQVPACACSEGDSSCCVIVWTVTCTQHSRSHAWFAALQ